MKFLLLPALLLSSVMLASTVQAAAPAATEAAIRARLKAAMPDAEITRIDPSPIAGLYQVSAKKYEPVFVSADGRYLIQGEMLEIKGSQIVSVKDQGRAEERKQALAAVAPADMIIFPASGKAKAVVYVFTDVDCGYCRKLHQEVPQLSKMGIEVRYLAFPRSGPNTPVAARMSAVWCAKDRQSALTQSKRGLPVPAAPSLCKSPVNDEYELGVTIGVRGTPAIFSVEGVEIGGYLPAEALAKALGVR